MPTTSLPKTSKAEHYLLLEDVSSSVGLSKLNAMEPLAQDLSLNQALVASIGSPSGERIKGVIGTAEQYAKHIAITASMIVRSRSRSDFTRFHDPQVVSDQWPVLRALFIGLSKAEGIAPGIVKETVSLLGKPSFIENAIGENHGENATFVEHVRLVKQYLRPIQKVRADARDMQWMGSMLTHRLVHSLITDAFKNGKISLRLPATSSALPREDAALRRELLADRL